MSPSPAAVSAALHPVVQARCSYTSLVYQDKEAASSQTSRTQDLVRCLVEWLVVLQRLEEERKADLPPVFCRCSKAVNINQELKTVGHGLSDVSRLQAGGANRGRGRGAAPGLREPGPGAAGRAGARDRGGERVGAGAGDRGGGDQAGLQPPGRGHLPTLLRWVTAWVSHQAKYFSFCCFIFRGEISRL